MLVEHLKYVQCTSIQNDLVDATFRKLFVKHNLVYVLYMGKTSFWSMRVLSGTHDSLNCFTVLQHFALDSKGVF
jgi:hypothetical protein